MRAICFDIESTDKDPKTARLVTAFVGLMGHDGEFEHSASWLLNPGVQMEPGAIEAHGITNEYAAEHGRTDTAEAIGEIAELLVRYCDRLGEHGLPLIIYNAPYDLTLLNYELVRNEMDPVPWPGRYGIIDPLVIDKELNRFVRGSGQRKLVPTAIRYGIRVDPAKAHAADYDCWMTGQIAQRQFLMEPVASMGLGKLQEWQANAKVEQSASLQRWFRSPKAKDRRDPDMVIDGSWPIAKGTPL